MTTSASVPQEFEFHVEQWHCAHGGGTVPALLYRPIGAPAPMPAIVDVHGGAWTENDCRQNALIHEALARSGVATLALEFQMPPLASFPRSLAEINLGIRWLKAHAPEFGIAPDHVGGLGSSSGGHQLMVNALCPRAPAYRSLLLHAAPDVDASLAFVILAWPVIDPLARYEMVRERGSTRLVAAHHAYFPDHDAMVKANPQQIVARGDASHLPPVLLLQGTADDNLPPGMADAFADAYRSRGGRIALHHFEGEPHTFVTKDFSSPASRAAVVLMKQFILANSGLPTTA